MKHWMQPKVMNENLKASPGRWVPAIASLVKSDPFWLKSSDPDLAPYAQEAVLGRPSRFMRSIRPPGADVIKNGTTTAAAIDKAFKRAEQIFARYTVG